MSFAIKVVLGMAAMTIGAYIEFDLPGTEIPFTGQSLALLLVAWFLPFTAAFTSVTFYLLAGFFGAPVLAGGSSGWEKLTGGSGGFLVGFVVSLCWIAFLKSRIQFNHARLQRWLTPFATFLIGTIVLLAFGNARLIQLFGPEKGLTYGLWPVLPGAFIKLLLATLIAGLSFAQTESRP